VYDQLNKVFLLLRVTLAFFFKILFIYFFGEKERERAGGGAEEEGERESQADSVLSTEPSAGLDAITTRS